MTLNQVIALADRGIIGEQWGTDGDDSLLGSVADDTSTAAAVMTGLTDAITKIGFTATMVMTR